MTINLTILVQAINFFLAYYIITKLFIKPALTVLDQEEKQESEALLELSSKTQELEELTAKKTENWKKSVTKFNSNKPEIIKTKFKFSWPALSYKAPSKALITELKQETVTFLEDKIRHVG